MTYSIETENKFVREVIILNCVNKQLSNIYLPSHIKIPIEWY